MPGIPPMTDPKTLVRNFLAASESGDRAAMDALLHPDFAVHEAPSLPYGGTHRGLQGYLQLVRTVFTAFRETRVEVDAMLSENDPVFVLARLTGRSRHGDTPIVMQVNEVWRVAEGRIHSVTPYYNDTARLNQIAGSG